MRSGLILAGLVVLTLAWPVQGNAEILAHGGPATQIVIDGKRIFSGGFDGKVLLWDSELQSATLQTEHAAPIDQLHLWRRDNAAPVLISKTRSEGARLTTSGQHTFQNIEGRIITAFASPNPEIACFGMADGNIMCAQDGAGDITANLANHPQKPVSLMAAAGRYLVAQHGRDAPSLYRLEPGAIERVRQLPADDIATATFTLHENGLILRGGSSGDLDLFSVEKGFLNSLHAHDAPILKIALNRDGSNAVTAGANGTIARWNIDEQGLEAETVIAQYSFPVLDLAIDETGGRVIIPLQSGRLEAVGLNDRAGAEAPARPPRLFAYDQARTRGAKLFNACIACHSTSHDRANKMGPPFGGLFGRKAGALPDYPYSEALRHSNVVWNAETLSALFKNGPDAYVEGTTMPLQRLPDPKDRLALIQHMQQVIEP